jgi:hypothetical protein
LGSQKAGYLKTAKTSETGVSAGAGRALLRPNQSTMTN